MSNYQGSSVSDTFEQLNANITSNTFKLRQNVNQLTQQSRLIGTSKDSPKLRDIIVKTIDSTNKLGTLTNGYFKTLSLKRLEKDQNLLIERSKRTYKEEFQAYGQLAKEISEKLKINPQGQFESGSNLITFEENERETGQRQQIQQQKQKDLDTRLDVIRDRDERVRHIESEIMDINVIMKDMASLVNEQSSIVDNIATNIETTYSNVENGNENLVQATKSASKYRKKILILIFIAFAVCVTLGLIIYFAIKH